MTLVHLTICEFYRSHWRVDLFFKWVLMERITSNLLTHPCCVHCQPSKHYDVYSTLTMFTPTRYV
jgi:hypothetical protein